MTVAIEDSGFEIRDQLMWLFGEGMPKGQNVGRSLERRGEKPAGWEGWNTQLKPAHEPVALARKPMVGSTVDNVLQHGTGALNVDANRIPVHPDDPLNSAVWTSQESVLRPGTTGFITSRDIGAKQAARTHDDGRYPPNVILDEEAAAQLDEASGVRRSAGEYDRGGGDWEGPASIQIDGMTSAQYADIGGASRFFYCAKATRRERDMGTSEGNLHKTVKPISLMRWLVRLLTPPGGLVLDPFTGSGSTGCAAAVEGVDFLGFELEEASALTARERIRWWSLEGLGQFEEADEVPAEPGPQGEQLTF